MSELLAVIEGEVIGRALPDHISAARDRAIEDGLEKSVVTNLAKKLTMHVREESKRMSAK